MHVEVVKGKGMHPWYVRLRASNGQILTTSEGYYSKWNAQRAAKRMFPELVLTNG
jgi:uncharacterized protein YegP (UPF0339 family)